MTSLRLSNLELNLLKEAVEIKYDIDNDTVLDEFPIITSPSQHEQSFTAEDLRIRRRGIDNAISQLQVLTMLHDKIQKASSIEIS